MVRPLRSFLRLAIPSASLALYGLIVLSFLNRWDQFIAITTIPIWVWAGMGALLSALAWPWLKSRLLLVSLAAWIVTGIAWADETPGLLRGLLFPHPPGASLPPDLRLVTVHCGNDSDIDPDQIKDLQPDVVCLQNFNREGLLPRLVQHWFGTEGDFVDSEQCAILASGKFLNSRLDTRSLSLSATLRTSQGEQIDLINVLFPRMPLRLELWEPEVTQELEAIRIANRKTLRNLLNQYDRFEQPNNRIVAGSFGAPPSDDIYRLLRRDGYHDSSRKAGRGWANTYPSRRPLVRMDQIWSSSHLKATFSRTLSNEHSDHRIVVSDFKFDRPANLIADR